MVILSDKIREARESCGLTQQGLADALGVSQVSVARWETGKRLIQLENLEVIAKLTNHSMAWFFEDEKNITEELISEWDSLISLLNDDGKERLKDYIELLLLKYHV